MRLVVPQLLAFALLASPILAAPRPAPDRAQVLVLGVYHMANPGHDVFNVQADDVLSPRRQKEIAELITVLETFHPTKIAIESNYGTEAVPNRYKDYLAGKRELTRNEIEQIGFRLAKTLGHAEVYPVDADGDFPLQRVANFAKANGKSSEMEGVLSGGWGEMVKEQGAFMEKHTVLETLLFINSDERAARDVGYYHQLARFGEPGDYAGPDLLTEWYRRNMRIHNHVTKLVTSPRERILVIFGSGHLGWLRQNVAADPSLRLRKLQELVPAAKVGTVRR